MQKLLTKYIEQSNCIKLNSNQITKIICYLDLLVKWNKVYNLTAITDKKEMISKHIMDSLIIGPYLKGDTFADIGSGAGLPGVPLSIMYPNKDFTLIDSRSKRTIFLNQVKIELKLDNVHIINKRAEEILDLKFDGIFSRAFSSLDLFYNISKNLLKKDGNLYAMKGIIHADEIVNVKDYIKDIIKLNVPKENGTRNLVIM